MNTTTETGFESLTGTYTLDPSHSRIGFVARHAMVTKVRGSFNDFRGTVAIDGADPSRSSAEVSVEVASIDTRNSQRDEHLRTNDFLAAEQYPQINFVSTGVAAGGDRQFDLSGDLTIRGVTRAVTIPLAYEGAATDPYGNLRLGFEGSVTISRKDFGITWNAALETGGVLVSDSIVLELEISAIKNA